MAGPSSSPPGPAHASRQRHPSAAIESLRLLLAQHYLQRGRSISSILRGCSDWTAHFCPLWPWLLTLTFKFIRVKDQTHLPYEFDTNLFSSSCHPLSNASLNNRTRFVNFANLAHKCSPNHHHKLRSWWTKVYQVFIRCRPDFCAVNTPMPFPILPSIVECESQKERHVGDFDGFRA